MVDWREVLLALFLVIAVMGGIIVIAGSAPEPGCESEGWSISANQ